ncbi:hypothetical protein EIN_083460 [Entamoeba invadens IP1]|uniref:hypothetical protein n=1 Tax=Entamoeba invadens IP1 TaxID=370355 RepID=UPI0002C3D47D|nr:hypothetical protein EIN_083460 [Entamoeba invadens IP1]ELP85214.1 hypothetical protein EIN_083460 [Entamoeba invadens IP1]|eukprot:XP_004184560.1 hypothetical protein EIN_083460 [Entamoeba invadens IP1]
MDVRVKPTTLADLDEEHVLQETVQTELNKMYLLKEPDEVVMSNTVAIKATVQQYASEVDKVMEHVAKIFLKRFKMKTSFYDRYGETHRLDMLRQFVCYSRCYRELAPYQLDNAKELYMKVFKNYDCTEVKCVNGVCFVLKYMMLFDLLRRNRVVGNVRLFRSLSKFVSSADLVKEVLEMVFDSTNGIFDALINVGYIVKERQYPQYCTPYTCKNISDLMATGIELGVLGNYLSGERKDVEVDIVKNLNMAPDAKQTIKNLNVIVGMMTKLGMPFSINGVQFFDYMLFRREPITLSSFLFQFLLTFKSVLCVPIHVVSNEISKICGSKITLNTTKGMFEKWANAIASYYGKTFSIADYQLYLPYLYILCYYLKIDVPKIKQHTDTAKTRKEVAKEMKEMLETLHAPTNLFSEGSDFVGNNQYVTSVLSFLFFYTQKSTLVDCAANSLISALRHFVERKRMEERRKKVSAIFGCVTVMEGCIKTKYFDEVVNGTVLVQNLGQQLVYEETVSATQDVQSCMKKTLFERRLKGVTNNVEDTQSVFREVLYTRDFDGLLQANQNVQAVGKEGIQHRKYLNENWCSTEVQSVYRMLLWKTFLNAMNDNATHVQTISRRMGDAIDFERIIRASQSFQAVFRSNEAKNSFELEKQIATGLQSVIRRNLFSRHFENVVFNMKLVQSVAREENEKMRFEEIVEASVNTASSMGKLLHSSDFKLMRIVTPYVQSSLRGKTLSYDIGRLVKEVKEVQSVLRRVLVKDFYDEQNFCSVDSQANCRCVMENHDYLESSLSQVFASSEIRRFVAERKYNAIVERSAYLQLVMRSECQKVSFRDLCLFSEYTEGLFRGICHKNEFNEFDNASGEVSSVIRTLEMKLYYQLQRKMSEAIQSVIRRNRWSNSYNTVIHNVLEPQNALKSVVYTCWFKEAMTGINFIQRRGKYYDIVNSVVDVQSIIRAISVDSFNKRYSNTKNVENVMRGTTLCENFKSQLEGIKNASKCSKSVLYTREYNDIVSSSKNVQSEWRRVIHSQRFKELECYSCEAEGILRGVLVRQEVTKPLEEHYMRCKYLREVEKESKPVQGICRALIVKYGLDLDDEVLQSLSYSCDLYRVMHSEKMEPREPKRKVSESPTKMLQSPSQRILPQEIVVNSIFLNKTTRMSFGGKESNSGKLYEYLRTSKRSILEIAFSNIRMIERRRLEEVQIGTKQLYEQIRKSGWFRVMFVKYNCVRHILDLLKASNKSPPFLEMVEKVCVMLLILFNDNASYQEFKNGDIENVVEVIGEIMRKYTEIRILAEATKLMMRIATMKPHTKELMKELCARLTNKMKEIETKEKLEIKRGNELSKITKKEFIYEPASSYLKQLITKVLGKQ